MTCKSLFFGRDGKSKALNSRRVVIRVDRRTKFTINRLALLHNASTLLCASNIEPSSTVEVPISLSLSLFLSFPILTSDSPPSPWALAYRHRLPQKCTGGGIIAARAIALNNRPVSRPMHQHQHLFRCCYPYRREVRRPPRPRPHPPADCCNPSSSPCPFIRRPRCAR